MSSSPPVAYRLGACAIAVLLAHGADALAPSGLAHGDVHIHEFLASNSKGLLDDDGDASDWIEVFNGGTTSVNLLGWFLTDDVANLTQWTFPSTNLAAGDRIVIFASGKDRALSGLPLHTNFKLSSVGEDLCLVRPNGTTLESTYLAFPPQSTDVSFGLKDSSSAEGYFDPPSPALPNGDQFKTLPSVEFSRSRGLKAQPFNLTLSHSDAQAQITFTLDGSDPATQGGTPYAAPLSISGTTIVRAFATHSAMESSHVGTHSYLFTADTLAQTQASATGLGFPAAWTEEDGSTWDQGGSRPGAWYGMDPAILSAYTASQLEDALSAAPTISLSMAMDDWFGDGSTGPISGIYSNSSQSGPAWERAGSMEWIDSGAAGEFQVNCGLSVQGSSSAGASLRNQLSFKLSFKGKYGPKKLRQDMFGDRLQEFDSLVLDAGHQNSPNGPGSLPRKRYAQGLRDAFMSDLQLAMGGLAPMGRPVHMYINGLYWGLYNLHERVDEVFAADHEGGQPGEYDYVKEGSIRAGNSNPWNHPTAPGAWNTAVTIAAGGLDTTDVWQGQPAYDAFAAEVDLKGYSQYLLFNYFGGNTDWPQNNWTGSAHSRFSSDWTDVDPAGQFRFHSWDAETVLYWGNAATAVGDGFYDRTDVTSPSSANIAYFYGFLRVNPEWRVLFADAAHEQIFHGALFVDPAYSTPGTVYDPAFPERNVPATNYYRLTQGLWPAVIWEYARWGNYWHSSGDLTPGDWLTEKDRLLDQYFPMRTGVLLAQLRNVQPQLYPDLDAPLLTQYGGAVTGDQRIGLSVPPGASAYFTLDGSDPRLEGGVLNPTAQLYATPFTLPGPTCSVLARAFDGTEWSALERGDFAVDVHVRINELQSSNLTTILDEAGQAEDWMELINPSPSPVDISGWGLSDDVNNPGKWRFPPATVLPARGLLVVWLDEDPLDGPLHANFKLSASGESLHLAGPSETGSVPLDNVSFGPLGVDRSLGRLPNGSGPFRIMPVPSPGQPNRRGDRDAR
ncbi:MAG TPA: hypothetical protein EYQ74_13550 [Planctomycetes bacterium]|nr:hypothetical protein [Planctomycetota bacterium]